jgi:hypothetical protein
LHQQEKANLILKQSTKEILQDFSNLKEMVLVTMDEISGKINEKEERV